MVRNTRKNQKSTKPRQLPPAYTWGDARDYSGKKVADTNAHDLIEKYDPEEQTLLEKIANRQKQFLRKSGDEEVKFVSRTESKYLNGVSVDHKSETNDLNKLFRS